MLLFLVAAAAEPAINVTGLTTDRAVTPLRFVHADASGARGRRLAPHKPWHRKLSKVAGWEMHGNLHTLGYFSADVCVGTPPHSFDLIIDTGSALTALPCADCAHCGSHTHAGVKGSARFGEKASSTSERVLCGHLPDGIRSCRTCDAGNCGYGVSYTEGSSIRGRMMMDTIWFNQAGAARRGVKSGFGCQTYESGLFYSQVADGISGFSLANTYGPTLFDWLRRSTGCPDVFSICLSETRGALLLGATVPASLKAPWIPYSGGGSYTVDLNDIRIKGASIRSPPATFHPTIVDSGTTFMYLPPDAYRKVRDHWRSVCPWGPCGSRVAKGEYPDDYCYTMSEAELDKFDPMSLHFGNGVSLDFGPRQQAYELRRGVWCMGVFDNEHNGLVLGGANMRNHEVVFDRAHKRLAFVPSDCGAMHDGHRDSVLEGGFALSKCRDGWSPDAPKASPPPPRSPPVAQPPPQTSHSPPPPPLVAQPSSTAVASGANSSGQASG